MTSMNALAAASAVALVAALSAQAAHAAPIFTATGDKVAGEVSSAVGNDVLDDAGLSDPLAGWFGAQLELADTAGFIVDLTFDFIAFEAAFNNQFLVEDDVVFENDEGTGGSFVLENVGAGIIDFGFFVTDLGIGVENGENPDNADTDLANFFLSFGDEPNGGPVEDGPGPVWLFLDDTGANDDDNHDDMLIRVSLNAREQDVPVSEPATLALLGAGLIGAGVAARRRKAA